MNGVIPMMYDAIDEQLVRSGAKRANTRRLRELIELTVREATQHVRARFERGEPLEGLAFSLRWQRRAGAWVLVHTLDAERFTAAEEILRESEPFARLRGCALTSIDVAQCVIGPAELIAGDTIKVSALDIERAQFSHDHVVLVRPDGSLGAPLPSIPSRPAGRPS